MKIYTKIVIDIKTGKVLETEGFDYEGEVALCCMGSPSAPKPSAQEIALQQAQLDILTGQSEDTALMRPFILQGMGLIEDPQTGELRYMTEEERLAGMSEADRSQYEITKLAQERQMQAYAGELPISPALEKSLKDQETQLSEALSQRLGPGWMESTAGQHAMMRFTQKADLVREEARRGEIAGGTGATLGNLAYMGGASESKTGMAAGFPGRTGGMMSGYGGILDRMSNERTMQYQAKSSRQAGFMGGMGSLIGSGVQAYGTYAGLAAMSSKKFKENIGTIKFPIDKIKAIRGVEFDWKAGHSHDVGVVAEEIEPIIPEAVVDLDEGKHVFYHKIIPLLIESIKAQQEQIDALKEVLHA